MSLINSAAAAEKLGYSEYTLRQSRSTGLLGGKQTPPYVVVGTRTIRYKEAELDQWINNLTQGSGE